MKITEVYRTFQVKTQSEDVGYVKSLGVYTGYIDDIAFALKTHVNGYLHFIPLEEPITINQAYATNGEIDILIDDYGCENLEECKTLFMDRDCNVTRGLNPNSIRLSKPKKSLIEEREEILQKLTEREKKILGLID